MKALLSATLVTLAVAVLGSVTVPAAQAQVRRTITFENDCVLPVRIFISHADGWRNWHSHGPFVLSAYEGPNTLTVDGRTLVQSDDHDLYYYAESLDGTEIWDGSVHTALYNGVTYLMRRAGVTLSNGSLNTRLTCD